MKKIAPRYLFEKETMIGTVIFTAVFSILFMSLYSPFSSTVWFSFRRFDQVIAMIAFYLVGISILLISKLLLYNYHLRHNIPWVPLVLWILGEVIFIALVYTVFTALFVKPGPLPFFKIYLRSIFCIFLIMLIPYVISLLYVTNRYQRKLIDRLGLNLANDKIEEMNPNLIHLIDNMGKLRLSLSIDTLYYIESEDNYVKIYYELDGKLCNYMLRSTTKAMEERFGSSLVRCHRSFLVNKDKISFFKNDRNEMFLKLSNDSIKAIPVSKTYRANIEKLLQEKIKE